MTLIYIFSPFFCTTTYRWSPHPSSAGGHNMLLTKRIPRQLSVSGFLYLNPQAPGNWACNVDSNMAPSVSVGSSMAGSDSSSVTLTYWSILGSSESSLSMLKISCESILPLFSRPQNNHKLHAFSLTGKVKMATYSSSIPECCVPEVKVSLTGSSLFRRRVRETDVSLETIIFFFLPSYVGIEFMRCRLRWFFSGKAN